MEVDSIAKLYAAKYIQCGEAETVAFELFDIMEKSIASDDLGKQEQTKQFLIRVVEIMNEYDKEFTEETTKLYFDLTIKLLENR